MESWESFLEIFGENRWVQSAVVLAVALIAAWLVELLIGRGIARLTARTATDLDDRLVATLRHPIRASVVIAGLVFMTWRLELSAGEHAGLFDLTRLTLNLLASIAILLWVVAGLRVAGLLLQAASGRSRWVEDRTLPLFRNLANIGIVVAGVYFAFVTWGIDLTAWLASAGIVGIAVGFAAKDTLANFFAGLFILTDAPYKLGDFINLDGGERGQVTHVGIRSTRLLTRDDVEITLPNSLIANSKIVNESGGRSTRQRLRVKVGVAYGSDIDRVREILLEVAANETNLCADPEPRVRFRAFGDSGLDFELLGWIEAPELRGAVSDALHVAIYKRFAAERVEIPYPKRDVYVRALPDRISD